MRAHVLTAVSILALSVPSSAFESYRESARSAAMGGALMAEIGSSMAVLSNPAALAGLSSADVSILAAAPNVGLPGIDMGSGAVSFGYPVGRVTVGAGYNRFEISGLMREEIGIAGCGVTLPGALSSVRAGVSAKYLNRSYIIGSDPLAASDPVLRNGTSASDVTMDGGIIWRVSALQAGLVVRNSSEPDLGLISKDTVPREIHGGVMYYLGVLDLNIAVDVMSKNVPAGSEENALQYSAGLEKWLPGSSFVVRGGFREHEITAGLGFRWRQIIIDYAALFNMNLSQDNSGTHIIGITYRFTQRNKRP